MSTNIDSIKRKLLVKYPTFGSIIANLEFRENEYIQTAGTDGKAIIYNPNFLDSLSEKQQIFLFAHEVSHVAFDHIYRSEGKDKELWNIATDAVINSLLMQDGLPIINGGVNIPEAVNYDSEEMYQKLLEKRKEENQDKVSQDGNQNSIDDNSENKSSDQNQEKDVGHDTHSLWEKAIEERKEEKDEKQEEIQNENIDKQKENENRDEENNNGISDFAKQGEKETFRQNKMEKRKRARELSEGLAREASSGAGDEVQRNTKMLSDIGIANPLIDWRRLLKEAIKYDEEWTRKNARMRNGYFKHRVQQIPIPETEILVDVSGSVSETLLKNFLRECKNIIATSRVKVGCFNEEFFGFTDLRKAEDIDKMSFPIGGGTDFDVAVEAFSRRASNKIIFTDGYASMPKKFVSNVIWVVYGEDKIEPKGGKVINITGEQLRRLYQNYVRYNEFEK